MSLSNKIASLLLVLLILADAVPSVLARAADISVHLPSNIIEVGKTQRLSVHTADGEEEENFGAYSFNSSNPEVVSVDALGNVTGVSVGRATVTVNGAAVEIPVVGANLLEEPSNSNIEWSRSESGTKFWWLRKYMQNASGIDYMSNTNKSGAALSRYSVAVDTGSGPVSDSERILRIGSKSVPAASEGIVRQSIYLMADYRAVTDRNKIYEFSGWAAAENVPSGGNTLHNAWQAKIFYYTSSGNIAPSVGKIPTEATAVIPFEGKSGNQPWTYFATKPIVNDGLPGTYNLTLRAAIDGSKYLSDGGWQGDILLSGLSLHEVVYHRLEFTDANSSSAIVLRAGESAATAVKHFTNTGNRITSRLTDANAVSEDIAVTYKSSDEAVATVSASGVITAHAPGTAVVEASATIGGVTKSQTMTVAVNPEGADGGMFGARYAYISNRGSDNYTVTVFAATETLDYNSVGFEIIGGDVARSATGTTGVYRSVNVKYMSGGEELLASLSAEDLGMDAGGYIFFRSENISPEYAEKGLIVRAYAENDDGSRVYGSYALLGDLVR